MRYRSKKELVEAIVRERDKLYGLLAEIPESRYQEAGVWGDGWNICDLMAHLTAWHTLFLTWFREGALGKKPAMPAPGYKWNETPRLNRALQKEHGGRCFADVEADFAATYDAVIELAKGLSEQDLFEPGRFAWTGSNPLVTYLGANTASHYRFAQKVLRRWRRSSPAVPPSGDVAGVVPESFEAYRQRVRGYLGDRDPLRVLRSTPSELDGLLAGCAASEATRRPRPGKWSIVEIVAHMCDAELAFGWRVRSVIAEPGAFLPWFDQDKWAEGLGYARRSLATELPQFRVFREANLVVVESVDRHVWPHRFGNHAVRGRQTLAEFIEMEAAHDLNHLRQIAAILESP